MYFKGALFIHTLRSVINDDAKFFKLQRDLYAEFKYKNNFTEEIVAFVSRQLGQDMTPIFDQYLRRSALPVLELTLNEDDKTMSYRWNAAERGFAMPIRVGDPAKWQIDPTVGRLEIAAVDRGTRCVQGRDRPLLRERRVPRCRRAARETLTKIWIAIR